MDKRECNSIGGEGEEGKSNNYWKAIAELLPNEVPTIEKKKGKKDQEKKPSIVVIQGPKPGKPTDLSRMQQLLVILKHDAPNHLNCYSIPGCGC
ncbi:hypothetical protein Q3G72_016950 [Acer saccharum]|nr:hypothetical protein Q3G72_016950 [Acer saccharum]